MTPKGVVEGHCNAGGALVPPGGDTVVGHLSTGVGPLFDDQDYIDDFHEAAMAAREREADDWQYMEREEDQIKVLEEVVYSVGAESINHLRELSGHVKFVVDSDRYYEALGELFGAPGRVVLVPRGSLGTREVCDDELHAVDGMLSLVSNSPGACFRRMCRQVGVAVRDAAVASPSLLPAEKLRELRNKTEGFIVLVVRSVCSVDDYRNHVQLVQTTGPPSYIDMGHDDGTRGRLYRSYMPLEEFLKEGTVAFVTKYYSGTGGEGFGDMIGGGTASLGPGGFGPGDGDRDRVNPPGSVRAESVGPGVSNISGGVVRRQRRRVAPKTNHSFGGSLVDRNYAISHGVMFNNISEVVLDSVSPEYAQEVLEVLFDSWGLPTNLPDVMKYAEDLVFTFLIASTASDKADYNRSYEVPAGVGGEVVADFKVLSDLLIMKFGLTRRQLARGLADRLRDFARHEDNAELRAGMADRAGCQLQYADLAFDGSTHCKGMGPTEKAFTRTLEARNLFESDGVMAVDASNRLLTGFNQRQTARSV